MSILLVTAGVIGRETGFGGCKAIARQADFGTSTPPRMNGFERIACRLRRSVTRDIDDSRAPVGQDHTRGGVVYRGATKPIGPDAIHTESAAVPARAVIRSPAPGSRTKTRLRPGRIGTRTSRPSLSDSMIEPSLLAR